MRARDAALKALRIQQVEYARQLAAYHAERLRQERLLQLRGYLRRDGYVHLAEQRRKDRAERLVRETEERQAVLAAHPVPRTTTPDRAQPRPGTAAPAPKVQLRPTLYKGRDNPMQEHER